MNTVTASLGRVTGTWQRTSWAETRTSIALQGWMFTDRPLLVRDALAAMAANPDEAVVPIVDPSGPTGLYRIDTLTATPGPSWVRVELEGAPVHRPLLPAVEVALSRSVRTNPHSITSAYHDLGVPGGAVEMWWLPASTATQETRTCGTGPAAGTVLHRRVDTAVGRSEAQYRVTAGLWWAGGCHVTVTDGGVDVPHVGRGSLPLGAWTATNGLVKVEFTGTGRLRCRWSTTAAGWTDPADFRVSQYTAITSASVVRLSAAEVVIAVTPFRSALNGRVTLMLRLRRGSPLVDCSIESSQSTVNAHQVAPDSATATTSNTGYVRRASTPAGAADWIIAYPDAATVNTTTGNVAEASGLAGTWQFGIGAAQSGGPTNLASPANIARSWFSVGGETVLVGVDP